MRICVDFEARNRFVNLELDHTFMCFELYTTVVTLLAIAICIRFQTNERVLISNEWTLSSVTSKRIKCLEANTFAHTMMTTTNNSCNHEFIESARRGVMTIASVPVETPQNVKTTQQ